MKTLLWIILIIVSAPIWGTILTVVSALLFIGIMKLLGKHETLGRISQAIKESRRRN